MNLIQYRKHAGINAEHVVRWEYFEKERRLFLVFVGGSQKDLYEDAAEKVFDFLSGSSLLMYDSQD